MSKNGDVFWGATFWICFLVMALVFALVKGCSDPARARDVLRAAGYTEVQAGGYEIGCGDTQCTEFTAVGPSGVRVRGVVSCGWFVKACTVRIDR